MKTATKWGVRNITLGVTVERTHVGNVGNSNVMRTTREPISFNTFAEAKKECRRKFELFGDNYCVIRLEGSTS
jgi:hypothetical protein